MITIKIFGQKYPDIWLSPYRPALAYLTYKKRLEVGIEGSESLNRWWSHCLILPNIWRYICTEAQMERCQTVTPHTTYLSAETVFTNQLNWPFVMNSAMADLIGTYFGVFFSCRSWTVTHADTVWLLMIKCRRRLGELGWSQVKQLHFSQYKIKPSNYILLHPLI